MNNLSRIQRSELKACQSEPIINCRLTAAELKARVGNPAGTDKADVTNPNYKGKVVYSNGKLQLNLSYVLTGNIVRAEIGLRHIREVYSAGGVIVNFKANPGKFDIRIHGATLAEISLGLGLCNCEAGLYIGGWAPSPGHAMWGNALLLASTPEKKTWKLTDAHEFGHKLGLKHRTDGGIMDYAFPDKPDPRRFTTSDLQRIIDLYR
ncbi:MAG: matrixin family metalloprotease [Cellvibrio sp.]